MATAAAEDDEGRRAAVGRTVGSAAPAGKGPRESPGPGSWAGPGSRWSRASAGWRWDGPGRPSLFVLCRLRGFLCPLYSAGAGARGIPTAAGMACVAPVCSGRTGVCPRLRTPRGRLGSEVCPGAVSGLPALSRARLLGPPSALPSPCPVPCARGSQAGPELPSRLGGFGCQISQVLVSILEV